MTDHICPEPGCGMLEERVLVERLTTSHDEHYIYECPRNADAHALCARVAELEAQLQEADAELCFCFRAFQEHGPTWASTPSAAVYQKAQGRQSARKEAPHEPQV